MIIHMDDYRRADEGDNLVERDERARLYANGVPALQLQLALAEPRSRHLPTPQLPDDFEDFDAKDFIERAYGLATQI